MARLWQDIAGGGAASLAGGQAVPVRLFDDADPAADRLRMGGQQRLSAAWAVRGCGRRSAVVLDSRRWLELRRFRSLLESGAISPRRVLSA